MEFKLPDGGTARIEAVKVADLTPDPDNPRQITERMLKHLDDSIETFGFVEPLVVTDEMQIVSGHQRVEVLLSNGVEEADAVVLPADWPESKQKALLIALNKVKGRWSADKLAGVLGELTADGEDFKGLHATGFVGSEVEMILAPLRSPASTPSGGTGDGEGDGGGDPSVPKFRMGDMAWDMPHSLVTALASWADAQFKEGRSRDEIVAEIVHKIADA